MEKALNFKRITRYAVNERKNRRAANRVIKRVEAVMTQIEANRDLLLRYLIQRTGQNRAIIR